MPSIEDADVTRMRDALFFEGPERGHRLSKFWVLLTLAAVIAGAGVITDSTATVIGAMIVAPLMTPILGIVLAIVLADRANLLRSMALVVAGACTVVAIAMLLGAILPYGITAQNNSQVAARISPRLMDLLAALATGAVGATALARSDISDTLPGVAIAISLVPPLSVVGLTLEAGRPGEAGGALLLFLTNVVAILASGVAILVFYRVHNRAQSTLGRTRDGRIGAVFAIAVLIGVIAIPLTLTARHISNTSKEIADTHAVVDPWASAAGWSVLSVSTTHDGVMVRATGPLPEPSTTGLRSTLDQHGLAGVNVKIALVPATTIQLKGS